jgi:hypothetical protein
VAFYGTIRCSGVWASVKFNWPAPRAIEGQSQARTKNNLARIDSMSAGHGGVLHSGAKDREEGICGRSKFSGGIEPITQAMGCVVR